MKKAIVSYCYRLKDVKRGFITHIHCDHDGAAWKFAELEAKIYAHSSGYPHLLNPEKFRYSAKVIYGDIMDRLWGRMQVIHHNAYRLDDVVLTGEALKLKKNSDTTMSCIRY